MPGHDQAPSCVYSKNLATAAASDASQSLGLSIANAALHPPPEVTNVTPPTWLEDPTMRAADDSYVDARSNGIRTSRRIHGMTFDWLTRGLAAKKRYRRLGIRRFRLRKSTSIAAARACPVRVNSENGQRGSASAGESSATWIGATVLANSRYFNKLCQLRSRSVDPLC